MTIGAVPVCRLAVLSGAVALLGGCASFDFGGGVDGELRGADGAGSGTQVLGTQLLSVTPGESAGVLSNQSGQRLRLFVTLLGEGPLDLRIAAEGAAGCAAPGASTLPRRGATSVLMLDKGCVLQAQSRSDKPSLLRIQTEGPKLDP